VGIRVYNELMSEMCAVVCLIINGMNMDGDEIVVRVWRLSPLLPGCGLVPFLIHPVFEHSINLARIGSDVVVHA